MKDKVVKHHLAINDLTASFDFFSKATKSLDDLTEEEDEQAIRVVNELNKFMIMICNKYQSPTIDF